MSFNKFSKFKPSSISSILKLAGKYRRRKPAQEINIERIRDKIDYSKFGRFSGTDLYEAIKKGREKDRQYEKRLVR